MAAIAGSGTNHKTLIQRHFANIIIPIRNEKLTTKEKRAIVEIGTVKIGSERIVEQIDDDEVAGFEAPNDNEDDDDEEDTGEDDENEDEDDDEYNIDQEAQGTTNVTV
mmetsp:Transcript_12009/g.19861  ORF Transcript_12009/g.19861 Transcript_12009/m.19861 type:complete len:108 (+) Transcript_12009:1492-1815(+)